MDIDLIMIPDLETFQKVNVKVKVTGVREVVQLVEKVKQDVFGSDHSSTGKLTLCEDHVDENIFWLKSGKF